jgi:hypothetical protein
MNPAVPEASRTDPQQIYISSIQVKSMVEANGRYRGRL